MSTADANTAQDARIAIVAIGRNEGERLKRCLASVSAPGRSLVYVDSNSSDGSVAYARSVGAAVVELDLSRPFTAARARNEGYRLAKSLSPHIELVQFVDGDCEIASGWMDAATAFLNEHADVAAVCGRRRERFPERSVYNRLCDVEWNTPIGQTKAFGGDVLIRTSAFDAAGGYRDDLIAGEEPELCVRLRANGWKLWRLDEEMTLHDAAMTRFSQWWRRTLRTGYAFAAGAWLHGAPPERHWVRESRSAWVWGALLPLTIVIGAAAFSPMVAVGALIYPLQWLRLAARAQGTALQRTQRAFFLLLGKFPEALGQIKFHVNRQTSTTAKIIEYK